MRKRIVIAAAAITASAVFAQMAQATWYWAG